MPSETEVISCPACKHLLRVPADWLGQSVQCPECKAKFQSPIRDGDKLTEPVLIDGPAVSASAPTRTRTDPLLILPAFGLMLVGVVSLIANGVLFAQFLQGPDAGKNWLKEQIPAMRNMGLAPPDGQAGKENNKEATDEQAAAELAPKLRWVWLAAAIAGGLTFVSGLSILRRKNYRLAQLGCVVAAVNIPHLCCVPGAIFGLWGLLMLMSDEGREHFVDRV